MALRWTTLDEVSVAAWGKLVNLLAKVDDTDDFYPPEALLEELREPGFDPARDSWAVWDGGQLVGFGQVRVRDGLNEGRTRAQLSGGVDPGWRGRGIGSRLIDEMQARAIELCAERHPAVDITLDAEGGLDGAAVRPLLERRGFELVRYFHLMRRALPGDPITEPTHPVEQYRAEFSHALHQAHNEAFAAHFGFAPSSDAEWDDQMSSVTNRPDCSYLRIAEDRAVAAYVMSYCLQPGELYIGRVGTVPAERGRGYARSCLLAALRAAVQQGYTSAVLHVDSINPTGAGALYESVGFAPAKTFASYEKQVPAAG